MHFSTIKRRKKKKAGKRRKKKKAGYPFSGLLVPVLIAVLALPVLSRPVSGFLQTDAKASNNLPDPPKTDLVNKFNLLDSPEQVDLTGLLQSQGKLLNTDKLEGKLVLVNFWATWCAPCKHEMPTFEKAVTLLGKQKLAVIAVSLDRTAQQGINYLTEQDLEHLTFAFDPQMKVFKRLKGQVLPFTLILNPQGYKTGHLTGPNDWSSTGSLKLYQHLLEKYVES